MGGRGRASYRLTAATTITTTQQRRQQDTAYKDKTHPTIVTGINDLTGLAQRKKGGDGGGGSSSSSAQGSSKITL